MVRGGFFLLVKSQLRRCSWRLILGVSMVGRLVIERMLNCLPVRLGPNKNFSTSACANQVGVNSARKPARFKRSGLTLIEILLVMAILVVVTAIMVPAIQRTFSVQALQKGADRVRVAMGQARVRAIRNGEEYAVFFNPDGSWFDVGPFSQFREQAAKAQRRENLADQRLQSDFEDDLLPRGIRFASGAVSSDSRSLETISENGASAQGGTQSILFYPDGTSQDARVLLRNEKGNFCEIQLRGLTGIARTVRLEGTPSVR